MPPTIVMEKQYWSFLSTYSMNEFRFAMNKGHAGKQRLAFRMASVTVFFVSPVLLPEGACKVETGVPSCVGLPLTAVECAAACLSSACRSHLLLQQTCKSLSVLLTEDRV